MKGRKKSFGCNGSVEGTPGRMVLPPPPVQKKGYSLKRGKPTFRHLVEKRERGEKAPWRKV